MPALFSNSTRHPGLLNSAGELSSAAGGSYTLGGGRRQQDDAMEALSILPPPPPDLGFLYPLPQPQASEPVSSALCLDEVSIRVLTSAAGDPAESVPAEGDSGCALPRTPRRRQRSAGPMTRPLPGRCPCSDAASDSHRSRRTSTSSCLDRTTARSSYGTAPSSRRMSPTAAG